MRFLTYNLVFSILGRFCSSLLVIKLSSTFNNLVLKNFVLRESQMNKFNFVISLKDNI